MYAIPHQLIGRVVFRMLTWWYYLQVNRWDWERSYPDVLTVGTRMGMLVAVTAMGTYVRNLH